LTFANAFQSALTPARCAADLAWLLQSEPLLSLAPKRFAAAVQQFDTAQAAAITAWLAGLDTAHLYDAVMQTQPKKAVPMRLGRYAECLMAYFLHHAGVFELVAANVPLRFDTLDSAHKDHTTVGEIDYLLRDTAHQGYAYCWHWELAVKFYVYRPTLDADLNTVQPHDFKGPAGVDTLGLKLGKMFDKQLQHQPPAPYNATLWQPAAYARGYLFYPRHPVPLCDALNPVHGRGWWLSITDFEQLADIADVADIVDVFNTASIGEYFVLLPRLHWLASYRSSDFDCQPSMMPSVLTRREMAQYLRQYWQTADARQASAGQLLACVRQDSQSASVHWHEVSRGFVMPY
jgi:hypothetical protein